MMNKLTWPEIAYHLERGPITVAEAIDIRRQKNGEYREGLIYNTKKAFDSGRGITLFVVDNSNNRSRSHFKAYQGQNDVIASTADSIGLVITTSSNAKYTENLFRVRAMLDHLSSKLGEHDMAIDQMEIASVNEGQIDDLSSPDIIIKHKGQFHRRETRIFVQEVNRKPTYSVCWYPRTPKRTCKEWPACPRCEETTDDWIFIIKKIDTETVMNWENLWPQFSKLWTDFNKRRKTRIDKITNQRGAQERDNQNRADLLEAQRRQERVAELYRIAKEEERKSIVRHKCIIAGLDPSFADCQVQSEKIEIISWLKSTFTRAYSSHSYQYMMEQNLRSLKKRKTLEIMRSRGYPNIANNYFSPPLALSSGE